MKKRGKMEMYPREKFYFEQMVLSEKHNEEAKKYLVLGEPLEIPGDVSARWDFERMAICDKYSKDLFENL